ncbi:hypothetical protein P171DRAFT_526050 [Karstenula rhodostoma CBS 690.94]|uniref:VWFA domain-containing protein n=1 Tax=Karstenula rhodostoma CBS 690.94 TaxID=1392251 RepID=A0A9P4P6W6_9PLEO|nr:hypothetical protein P171DRAFT_526050 [Karstenula rhodostoma CBS 690.94]
MASKSWKIFSNQKTKEVKHIPFIKSRKFFAVDDSGPTAGHLLIREREFVECVRNESANQDDSICLWGSNCDIPTGNFENVWRSMDGGTSPGRVLEQQKALKKIQQSDVWFLITDGEVDDGSVHQLADLAQQYAILNAPIVFLTVGYRGATPKTTNISVGVSFFAGAQNTLILFKDSTDKIYIIATKGCFASLGGSTGVQDLTNWTSLPSFVNDVQFLKHCQTLDIEVLQAESRGDLSRGVSLGADWEEANGGPVWVDLDLLLQAGRLPNKDVFELLSEEAFNNLDVAYKIRRRTESLRSFIQAQKIEQLAPRIEDVSGVSTIIAKLELPEMTGDERKLLKNAVNTFATSVEAQTIQKRNQLVDAAMRTLASIEAASFNAEILSRRSNRARRSEVVAGSVEMASLDLLGPAYKGNCLICCGDDETTSICLEELDAEHADDNTTDFALNFPLAAGSSNKNVNIILSQNVSFQCVLLAPSGMSIFNEKLNAILPAVHYDGPNKKYINEQLYFALTAGLAQGAAGIAQLPFLRRSFGRSPGQVPV